MTQLPESVETYFEAANEEQPAAFIAAFDENAFVFDDNREFKGLEAIRNWSKTDVFGAHVRFAIIDVMENDGAYAVTASLNGDFDKTNLPNPFLLEHTFKLSGGKIKELQVKPPNPVAD